MKRLLCLFTAFAWLGISLPAHADNRLATIFQDNMVLQREKPVPVWGWADPGAQVEVDFAGQSKKATADDKGYWKAVLDPLTADAVGQDLTAKIGSTTVTCKNVLIGEVWFTASHSALGSDGPDFDTGFYPHYDFGTGAGKPEIRYCQFGFGASLTPYDDIDPAGRASTFWKTFNENPASQAMTAVGYFARKLRNELNVPVGIVQMLLVSGTDSPTWCSRETLESFPAVDGHANFYEEFLAKKNAQLADPRLPFHSFDEFKKLEDAWRVSKTGPWPGAGITLNGFPTMGYNTRIYPLHPFAVRGVIFWAMGGTDHGVAAPLDVAMLKQWRDLFGQQDLCFLESGCCRYTTDQPPLTPCLTFVPFTGEMATAIRQAALLHKDDPKMAPVDLFDTGDWVTHLMDKSEQGVRFADAALTVAYGKDHIYTGPRMLETKFEGNKVTVRFDHVGDGLVYQPSIDGISGVYLCDKDGKAAWAEVNITGKDTIECSSPDISQPSGIAYAENTNAHETLFSSEGGKTVLPASPFITNPISTGTAPKFRIVSMVGETGWDHVFNNAAVKNAHVSLAHLRRTGYVFQIIGQETLDNGMKPIANPTPDLVENTASVPVVAYIPAEWKDYEVVTGDKYDVKDVGGFTISKGLVATGGKPLTATDVIKDGNRFATFNAPVDSTWVIVAEKGKAADFAKVNRY